MVATIKRGATKESIKKILDKVAKESSSNGIDTKKYCGTLMLKHDPLTIQKRLRDEWE